MLRWLIFQMSFQIGVVTAGVEIHFCNLNSGKIVFQRTDEIRNGAGGNENRSVFRLKSDSLCAAAGTDDPVQDQRDQEQKSKCQQK